VFACDYGVKWPKAVAKITDDAEELLTFFDFPWLLICERGCWSTESSWSWLVLRWWLGAADRAGVKVERPERRVDDDLDAGEGRHRMKQRREAWVTAAASPQVAWSVVARGRPALSRCSDQVRRHDG
jgi:hypothetical protein